MSEHGHLGRALLATAVVATLGACGGGRAQLPEPRPLVIHSGARINVDQERLEEIHAWVIEATETMDLDPSFLIMTATVPEPRYPWETLTMSAADTVRIAVEPSAPDATTSYQIYAFLHEMKRTDRLVEWFQETEFLEGFELERFIVARTADSWLLGRATFDTHPYRPLDELIYANEAGLLDAFLLYQRGDDFPEARDRYLEDHPDGFEVLEGWYQETFGGELPAHR